MRVSVQRDANVRMTHNVLQRFRIATVCHVGTKCMPAHMGRYIRHLHFIDLVVLLPDMLHILFPMLGNHRPPIFIQEQEPLIQPPLRITDNRLRFQLFTVLRICLKQSMTSCVMGTNLTPLGVFVSSMMYCISRVLCN